MSKKFLYVNSDGDYNESTGAFEQSDFVSSSTGAADAGKPVVLDSNGLLGSSMVDDSAIDHNSLVNTHNLTTDIDHNTITNTHNLTTDIDHDTLTNSHNLTTHIDHNTITNTHNLTTDIDHDALTNTHNLTTDIDHGAITGLGDDDHTIYTLANGTRDFTGVVSYNDNKTFTAETDIVSKKYVDDVMAAAGAAAEWQDSCISRVGTPPVSPSEGDRYLIHNGTTGEFVGHEQEIAEWDGTQWVYTVPTVGSFVSVDDQPGGIMYFGGTQWNEKYFEGTTASTGLEKVGLDIRLDMYASGGLKLIGNEVAVEPNDFVGAGLVDDGSDNIAIDWSTTFTDDKAVKASDFAASIIPIADAGAYTDETNVEGAIQELYSKVEGLGNEFDADAGGVSKGDLLYISGDYTVQTHPTNISEYGIGIADRNAAGGSPVKALANDTIIEGILTGATAGQRLFWSGTGWVTTIPTGSGAYVWQGGIAVNATDMQIEIAFIKRNS